MSEESAAEPEPDEVNVDELVLKAAQEAVDLAKLLAQTIENVVQEPELRDKLKQQEHTIIAAIARTMRDARDEWIASAGDERPYSTRDGGSSRPRATGASRMAPQAEATHSPSEDAEPPSEMLERMDAELTALSLLDTAIRHFDKAAVTLELADRSRYTSALVLLVTIKRSLLRGHNAYAVRQFLDLAMQGRETPVQELNDFFRPIHEAGPYDPANISDAQRQQLPALAVATVMRRNQDPI